MTEAPPTKIAVFTKDELNKYGYKAVTHQDGYIYFERSNELTSQISLKPEFDLGYEVKEEPCEPTTEDDNILQCGQNAREFSLTSSAVQPSYFTHSQNDADNLTRDSHFVDTIASYSEILNQADVSSPSDPRDELHFSSSYDSSKLKHAEEIRNTGFSSCPLSTCNFISLSVAAMVRHTPKCNGVPKFNTNLCTRCNRWLISPMQRDIHAGKCQGINFCVSSSTAINPMIKKIPVVTVKDSKPKLKKRATASSHTNKNEIVQPGLKRPAGSYLRKRSYNSLHFEIWTKKYEDHKYIPCHFKGCHFIALSVGDMCQHWAYCSGDSSFAKYQCHHCLGVVTSQSLLDIHIASSHSKGDVIGREEEYPCQDDKITESLELLCNVPVSNKKVLHHRKKNKFVRKKLTDSSIDHTYSSFSVNDNIKHADELELFEIYETTFSLNPQPPTIASSSLSHQLESPTSVKKKSVIVEVSEIVKNCDLNIVKNADKLDENTSFHELNADQVQDKVLENGSPSPLLNVAFSRETVITDGRLINRISKNDKTSDSLLGVAQNENTLIDPPPKNLDTLKQSPNEIINIITHPINMNIENNTIKDSVKPEPVMKKRGRPKKVKPDLSVVENNEPVTSVINFLSGKRRQNRHSDDKIETLPRSARRRTAIRLHFSDDSDTESSANEDSNNIFCASEELKNTRNTSTSLKRNTRRPPQAKDPSEAVIKKSKCNTQSSDHDSESDSYIPPKKRRGRPRKTDIAKIAVDEHIGEKKKESKKDDEDYVEASVEKGKRSQSVRSVQAPTKNDVKCGKCEMVVKRRFWEVHNAKNHTGLGWEEGEPPIDQRTLDPQTLLILLRSAFKICKSAACELCGTEKKSFLGMHSHIMICGKTSEEVKEALVTCDVCGKQLQSYCMPTHKKIHEKGSYVFEENVPLPKRRSAIKAVTNLQHVLAVEKKIWIQYKKGDPLPELNFQFKSTGKGQVPCTRENCKEVLTNNKFAMEHVLECPTVPEQYYQCLECQFFSLTEEGMIQHCDSSHEGKENKDLVRDYDVSTDSEEDEEKKEGANSKRIRTSCGEARVTKAEYLHKSQFITREKVCSRESQLLYHKAVEEEMLRESKKIKLDIYDTLYTYNSDWTKVPKSELKEYLPPLDRSLSVRHRLGAQISDYQILNVFESLSSDKLTVGFVGGAVQNISWCPTSMEKIEDAHQYLALSVENDIEKSPLVRSSNTTKTLLQIWDCGTINDSSNNFPSLRMVLGVALDFGELWDLTWSPNDTWLDGDEDDDKLPRLGLVATACHDGAVRLYSISVPKSEITENQPIYKVHPVVILKREDWNLSRDDACLRLSWGEEGVLCAGYRSGLVSVWRLQELKCSHIRKQDKTYILQNSCSFYPHFYPITDIALCPSNNRILATAGSDKRIKVWDLMNIVAPLRTDIGSAFQAFSWINNWPILCYLAEENVVGFDMPPHLNFCKSMQLKTQSSINDISFNNWAFLTGVVNRAGEFYIRQNIDPYIDSKKKPKMDSVVCKAIITSTTEKLNKDEYNSYADLENNKLGITFTDYNFHDSLKTAEKTGEEPPFSKYTANSIKKMAFNPNYRGFHHAALGLQCGFIRVLRLKFLQKSIDQLDTSLENN